MNCRDLESLLLTEKDGVLTTAQHATLEQHVATCPTCGALRESLAEVTTAFRAEVASVAVPDSDAEWQIVQARLAEVAAQPAKKRPLAPVIWFGAPLAAAAAVAFTFFIQSRTPWSQDPKSETPAEVASADFVESGNADASTMVYVDKDSGWLVVWATDGESERSG